MQATDALEYYNPPSLFTPLDFGLVGFSFACGLGVKIAKPKKTVVSLMGDGGFGMTISELSTAVEYGINTTTIVMNNQSWGAEKAYQKDFFGKRYLGADITSPSFDKVAELYGAKGFKVKKISEINGVPQVNINSSNDLLYTYHWPGNVRELRNLIERIAILQPDTKDKISNIIKESLKIDNFDDQIEENSLSVPLKEAREKFEKEYLTIQLKKFNGNISKTANFVGMERSALHRKLKGLGIKEFN